jgi:thiamine biosynthesis lipoprotein
MSTGPRFGRRRVLAILGAALGLPLLPERAARAPLWRWDGYALGAAASIRLHHPDGARARSLITACVAELRRLEAALSLYRADSELCRLNRHGDIRHPSRDILAAMREARAWSARTAGAFDPTVQPLWRLYADHFARRSPDAAGPRAAALAAARDLVDWRSLEVSTDRIAFVRPGMAATLNGIAQGFVTDRIVDRLRDGDIDSTLVEMGEAAAIGLCSDGTPWSVGIPDAAGRVVTTLPLTGRAVATSAGSATRFEPTGRFHHLFDPATGECAHHVAAVSVAAPSATAADALSTALFVTPVAAMPGLLERAAAAGAVEALIQFHHGPLLHMAAAPSMSSPHANPHSKGTTS